MPTYDAGKYDVTHFDGHHWHVTRKGGEYDELLIRRFRYIAEGMVFFYDENGNITGGRATIAKYGNTKCERHIALMTAKMSH